jgi:hypothetical protein
VPEVGHGDSNGVPNTPTAWQRNSAQLKSQWLVILTGAIFGLAVAAITSLIYAHVWRPLTTSAAAQASAVILNLNGRVPVIKPSEIIQYSVKDLPPNHRTWLAVITGPNDIFPESAGSPTPGHTGSFDAKGITLGAPTGKLCVVMTDLLGTAAFHGYLHDQVLLGHNGFAKPILNQSSNPDADFLTCKRVFASK